jgi:hypothetical protein
MLFQNIHVVDQLIVFIRDKKVEQKAFLKRYVDKETETLIWIKIFKFQLFNSIKAENDIKNDTRNFSNVKNIKHTEHFIIFIMSDMSEVAREIM